MTVEVRPLGDKCNIKCRYCYQEGIRTAGNVPTGYDLNAIVATLDRLAQPFSLFGGEVMMTPRADLERLMQLGLDRHGGVSMQTNGTLIDERDIDLFKKYKVRLGISIDGPGPLNDARWAGSLSATRRATARIEAVIETLCRDQTPPNVIVTLNRLNAGPGRLDILCEWMRFFDGLGVRSLRLHLLEQDDTKAGDGLALSVEENLFVLRRLRALEGICNRSVSTCSPRWPRCCRGGSSDLVRIPRLRQLCHPRRRWGRERWQVQQLRAHEQGRRDPSQGWPRGVRAPTVAPPHTAGARRMQGLQVLSDMQGQLPGHGDRR